MTKYKVHTTYWVEADSIEDLQEEINKVESGLETSEQSTYEEIEDD